MTEQPQASGPALPAPGQTTPTESEKSSSGLGAQKMIVLVLGAFMAVTLGIFLLAVILAVASPESADRIQIIRDFFIIIMALEGIVVGAALIVLVLQLARLTNLLQNEIKPILDQTSDTVKTVRGTATFVSRNVTAPVIRASGLLTFLLAFLRELFGLRRAVYGGRKERAEVHRDEGGR